MSNKEVETTQEQTTVTDVVITGVDKTKTFVKNNMYDFIAIGLVLAMIIVVLDIFGKRDATWESITNLIIAFVPFYFVAVVLNVNYYNKGIHNGKLSQIFTDTITEYSKKANLTGDQVDTLPEFCEYYNNRARQGFQEVILQKEGISFAKFNNGERPLKQWSRKELKEKYTRNVVKCILKAKAVKVKRINTNILLSNVNSPDITNIGLDEKQLKSKRKAGYVFWYIVIILLLGLIVLKDVQDWNWLSLALVIFKILYVFCRSLLRYFEGYEDITSNIVNHITRKTDILKQYRAWYKKNYPAMPQENVAEE